MNAIPRLIAVLLGLATLLVTQASLFGDAGAQTHTNTGPPAAVAVTIIWYMARQQPIGGWLLYYYISLYAGLVFSLLLLATTLSGGKRNRALNVPSNVQPGLCQGTSFRHFRRSIWWKRSVFERDLAAIWPRDEKDQLRREKQFEESKNHEH